MSARLRALTSAGRMRSGDAPEIDVAVVLDLLDAAGAAGCQIPAALAGVGRAIGGERGALLSAVAAALGLGAAWEQAWADGAAIGSSAAVRSLTPVADALAPSWAHGAPSGALLRGAAAMVRRERHAQAMAAAGRLGVQLVLPLGLCHLPAFVLVGLVPVLISLTAATLR